MNILVVGNVLKDVYLRLDERQNRFEKDAEGTDWLDLGFNEQIHPFFRRTSVYGGAAVSLEVLRRFGMSAKIMGESGNFGEGSEFREELNGKTANYRYILCHDNQVCYLSPSERAQTKWVAPEGEVDWIFIDRSANVSAELMAGLREFKAAWPKVHIAVYIGWETGASRDDLLAVADVIFTEEMNFRDERPVCRIGKDTIWLNEVEVSWFLPRKGLMTHLTAHSIIAASVLGALLKGRNVRDSLLAGKVNVENAALDGSLDWKRIEDLIAEERAAALDLETTAAALLADGKGILAADESGGSIHKKFEEAGIVDDFENRRKYRQIFITTPDLEKYVNGVILFDETARQKADDGRGFVDILISRGIIPGIKVDQGLENLPGSTEKYTKGLEGLDERLREYYGMGLRFAKWRAAFNIEKNGDEWLPSERAIIENCRILAEYASACQKARIVPIVEPEVVYDGDYTIEKCAEVTSAILRQLFAQLELHNVDLKACILKCNMVMAGKKLEVQSTAAEVGLATAEVLRNNVPGELAGVVFLSGGQAPEQATENLLAVQNEGMFPWPVTFSFARALQGPALDAWAGRDENVAAAQEAFTKRLTATTRLN